MFKVIIALSLFLSFSSSAQQRIDIDYRYSLDSSAHFIGLFEELSKHKKVRANGQEFDVSVSKNEHFVDVYFDTPSLRLFRNNSSLRFRQRFLNLNIFKKLIQYKVTNQDYSSGMIEKKIVLNPSEIISSGFELYKVLNSSSNLDSDLVRSILLDGTNLDELEEILRLNQLRNRIYLKNITGETVYTITFDNILISKGLIIEPYWIVEFEINEKLFKKSKKQEKQKLIDNLINLISENFANQAKLIKVDLNKYSYAVKKLKLDLFPENNSIFSGFIPLLALVGLLLLFFTLRNKKLE